MEKSKVKRFGILTSGGDAPGLNTAIRGVARAAIEQYGMEVVGIQNGYRGLIQGNARQMFSADFSGILTLKQRQIQRILRITSKLHQT